MNSCKCCSVSFNWSLLGCKKSKVVTHFRSLRSGRGCNLWFVMVSHVPESEKAPQQQQFPEQWDQHQKQSKRQALHHFSVWCGPSQPVFTECLQSVDSSLGGLSRSSTVASLDTDSTKSSGRSSFSPRYLRPSPPFLLCLFTASP